MIVVEFRWIWWIWAAFGFFIDEKMCHFKDEIIFSVLLLRPITKTFNQKKINQENKIIVPWIFSLIV